MHSGSLSLPLSLSVCGCLSVSVFFFLCVGGVDQLTTMREPLCTVAAPEMLSSILIDIVMPLGC